MKTKFFIQCAFILMVIIFAGCAINTGINLDNQKVPEGYGILTVEMLSSRSMTVSSYHVTASKSGETDVTDTVFTNSCTMTLKLGVWHIEVTAKNSDGLDVYYGYNDVDVVEGGTSAKIGLAAL